LSSHGHIRANVCIRITGEAAWNDRNGREAAGPTDRRAMELVSETGIGRRRRMSLLAR
jgi:hypothetical protein